MNPDELAFRLTDVFYVAFGANQGTTTSFGIDYTNLFPVRPVTLETYPNSIEN